MAKHFLEDMVIAKRQRNGNTKPVSPDPRNTVSQETRVKEKPIEVVAYSKNGSRYLLWFVAFISIIFCLFAVSFLFSKAEVVVSPKSADLKLNKNLSATLDSNVDAGGLAFDLIVIEGEENKVIQATGQKNIENKATGVVVIYNAFGSSAQTLAIDTRLEGSNGKIYKTKNKIIVPGKSKAGTPGSVEVEVYGAEAGQAYNSAPLDFKILGFKGTSKYSGFYGRSKGAITGGFVGKAPVISDEEKATAQRDLKTALEKKLLQQATGQISNGFILFKDAIFLDTDDSNISSISNNEDNSMTLTQKGTLRGILLNEEKLTKKIAEDNIDGYDGSAVFIPNIKEFTFSLSSGQSGIENKNGISFSNLQNISFNLSGSGKIVWKVDTDKLASVLLGKSKKDFNSILAQYGNINSASLTLNPFWKMSIPDKTEDIKIIVNYPK